MFKKTTYIIIAAVLILSCVTAGVFIMASKNNSPLKLNVTFDKEGAKNNAKFSFSSGKITGEVKYTTSFDGTKALEVKNPTGEKAEQYVAFSGKHFGTGNFTLSFWYKENKQTGGFNKFQGADNLKDGGTLFSNTDTKNNMNSGLSVITLPGSNYGVYAIPDGFEFEKTENARENYMGTLKNITDAAWHKISITVDRENGTATYYVDGVSDSSIDISEYSDTLDTDAEKLVFGADAVGAYGTNGAFDNIEIYNYALDSTEIKIDFDYDNYKKLITEIETEIKDIKPSARFSKKIINGFKEELTKARDLSKTRGETDFLVAYETLQQKYLDFLNGNKPLGVAILTSDTHITATNCGNTDSLVNALEYSKIIPYKTTTLVNLGDYDENSIDYDKNHPKYAEFGDAFGEYFNIVEQNFAKGQNITHAVCVGNHQYTHPGNTGEKEPVDESNYLKNVTKYIDFSLAPNQNLADKNDVLKKTYYYTTDGVAHYIVLNPWENSTRALEYNFSKAQYDWLKNTLEYCKKDKKPIFVLNHIGLDESVMTGISELLSKYPKVIYLSGHTHISLSRTNPEYKNGVTQMVLPAALFESGGTSAVHSGAYYAYIYEDQIALRALDTTKGVLVPQYDKTIYLNTKK